MSTFQSLKRRLLFACAWGALLGATTGEAHAAPAVIAIERYAFAAAEITVAPGTTVEWVNRDETPHNIVSADRLFASKGLDTGDRFAFAFDREGDYTYFCALHPFMTGIVHVRRRGT